MLNALPAPSSLGGSWMETYHGPGVQPNHPSGLPGQVVSGSLVRKRPTSDGDGLQPNSLGLEITITWKWFLLEVFAVTHS